MASNMQRHGASQMLKAWGKPAQNQSASGMQRAPRNAVRLTIMSLVSASMAEARNRFSAVVPARSTVPLWHTVGGVHGTRGASGQPVPHYRRQGSGQRAQLQACQPSTLCLPMQAGSLVDTRRA